MWFISLVQLWAMANGPTRFLCVSTRTDVAKAGAPEVFSVPP